MFQCAAMCCSVLQCVVVCCSVSQCVVVCCSVLQCVAMCGSVLQCLGSVLWKTGWHLIFVCVAACVVEFWLLFNIHVCCGVLQCVAVCRIVFWNPGCSIFVCVACAMVCSRL